MPSVPLPSRLLDLETAEMAARSIHVTDVRELIRLLRKGEADRRIARDLSLSRNTVAKYRSWASQQGLLGESLPSEAELERLQQSLRHDAGQVHRLPLDRRARAAREGVQLRRREVAVRAHQIE